MGAMPAMTPPSQPSPTTAGEGASPRTRCPVFQFRLSTYLYKWQQAIEGNLHPHPRGVKLKAKMKGVNKGQRDRDRANYVDRGADGAHSGYSAAEFAALNLTLLQKSGASRSEALRTRLDILLGHYLVLRGQ